MGDGGWGWGMGMGMGDGGLGMGRINKNSLLSPNPDCQISVSSWTTGELN
ncbi:MAG UNVERIFIED_CONTAM: hypothetical protein LVR29_10220 [Microcystis novacekii LVE1205-3]